MSTYKHIEDKLHQFIRKYYTNELIKGGILFLSLGCLYFFITLFIEYFLWLKPLGRTLLFWLFVFVECYLLFRFVLLPIFKLFGIKKGISYTDSSSIISNHFPKVGDTLLNVLQLKMSGETSELLMASIEQKSKELQPIPFNTAINLKANKKYLPFAAIPLLIWIVFYVSGNTNVFNSSFERVVSHRTAFSPPPPFVFQLLHKDLKVIEGDSFTVEVSTVGNVVPTEVKIFFNNQSYFLQNKRPGVFSYTFENLIENTLFYVSANTVVSNSFQLEVIKTPVIQGVSLVLTYPRYIRKKNDTRRHNGNVLVPEGTKITWQVDTKKTDTLTMLFNDKDAVFSKKKENQFLFSKKVFNTFNYQLSSSNSSLKNFEKLSFTVDVIKDEHPKIEVLSDVDSTSNNIAQFAGKVSDDYGVLKVEVVYYDEASPNNKATMKIPFQEQGLGDFYFQFPGDLTIKEGVAYEMYFQVFDNDAVNGSKKAVSKKFSYRKATLNETNEKSIQFQKDEINNIELSIKKQLKKKENLEEIKQQFQQKKQLDWTDKKKLENFIKRQQAYKQMLRKQTNNLQKNIKESPKDSDNLLQKKDLLNKRIDEFKKLEKKLLDKEKKLLKELQKVTNKLNKEDLIKKIKQLSEQNKQEERSLERLLELTKRFYIEQKSMQIANKLGELSKKQKKLQNENKSNTQKQTQIKKEFKSVQKELQELKKDNNELKEPMPIPDTTKEEEETLKELNNVEKNPSQSKSSQQKAAQKMEQIRQKIEQSMMAMEGEMKEVNAKALRIVLENLLNFSFQQETSMSKFSNINVNHPSFGKELKKQNDLRSFFKHVDDSLYVLALRMPEISVSIQNDLTNAHYNLNQSLENFSQNRFYNGLSNQQYVLTSVNNLADFLSDILDNLQQPKSMRRGKGKGKKKSFSLPNIIKQQEKISKNLQKGIKKGRGKNEQENESLYKIYQEQSFLKQAMKKMLQDLPNKSLRQEGEKVLKTMEELEKELLEKGFSRSTVQKMQQLKYNLLKLNNAYFEQEKDNQRKAKANTILHKKNNAQIFIKKQFYNQQEILNRQSLPLQKKYKNKVQEYFRELNKRN